jgi:hypothetical protein
MGALPSIWSFALVPSDQDYLSLFPFTKTKVALPLKTESVVVWDLGLHSKLIHVTCASKTVMSAK